MHLETAAATDVGLLRKRNEDCVRVRSDGGLGVTILAVADGMGGAPAGDVASARAVEIFQQRALDLLAQEPGDVEQALRTAMLEANAEVLAQARKHAGWQGMGTTLVAACLRGTSAWVINLGDSRAYHCRDGDATAITQDHSYVEEQVRAGRMTPEEAARSPHRHVLTQALGGDGPIRPDLFGPLSLEAGEALLLCSDGLHGVLSEAEIAAQATGMPSEAVRRLIAAANDRGGPDNITVALTRLRP